MSYNKKITDKICTLGNSMIQKRLFKIIIFFLIPFICLSGLYLIISHMYHTPIVSVVMPVYNRPELVGRAITSILNQTMKDFELIIVDDGSDKLTKDILKQYADQDNRIRLIPNPKNRGIAYSRQRGADAARGKYIAIMDSDDWSVPDRLEKSIAFMQDYPEMDAVGGTGLPMPKDKFIPDYVVGSKNNYTVDQLTGYYDVELAFANVFWNVCAMYKRSFAEKHQIRYNEQMIAAEDYDFWRQFVLFGGKIGSLKDVLTYIRMHSSNPQEYYEDMHKNAFEIKRKMISRFFPYRIEDVKFTFPLPEKCLLLKKMIESNQKESKIPHSYLENRFSAQCPVDFEKALYLEHPFWSDFLVASQNDKWQRYRSKDEGRILKEDEKITIFWDRYPQETFYLQKDGKYQFSPEGEKMTLKHPYWSDSIIISPTLQKSCRISAPKECAIVRKIGDNRLVLEWENPQWKPELFQKNKDDIWVFVREESRK